MAGRANMIVTGMAITEDLQTCVDFHGHLCPGLVYGYLVAKEAMRLLGIKQRAVDEEVVAICESDTCAVDALQALLGTTAGKGNLIIHNYGKNAFTILSRSASCSYRFMKRDPYEYRGEDNARYERLDAALMADTASEEERSEARQMKIADLLTRPFESVFMTTPVPFDPPAYAPMGPSDPCANCGEMTMRLRMVEMPDGRRLCVPCAGRV